ncbi:MAG: glycosyltransferase 87 family protein [Nocardioides sp.]|uniref:glycosyltransferase family 87 protein n=1 Tax=Nocardioides sp. TaxID=35761 RepID=UPI0039E4E16B
MAEPRQVEAADADQPIVAPALEDPVVLGVSESIGGPLGRHAHGTRRWFTVAGILLLLTSLTFAVGMTSKKACYDVTWSDGTTQYSYLCYSDLPFLYTARGFSELKWPYSDNAEVRARYTQVMEYPVGISYYAWTAAQVTHVLAGSPDLAERAAVSVDDLWNVHGMKHEIRLFVVVNVIGFAIAALLATWMLAGTNRRRPWDAAAFALSPMLAVTGMINWDLLAVVFVAGAMWSWARGRPLLTGVFVGLGTATKLYPLFLLGGLLVICWRERRWRDFVGSGLAAALAWVLVNLPAYATGAAEWKVFWTFNAERGPDLGSLWLVVQQAADVSISAHTVNIWSWLLFGAWCAGVLALGMRAPTTPQLAQLGFLIVAGFLIVNKVYSPQYVLWLLPLAVLARPRWRDQIVWQAGELLYFCCVWWYLGGELTAGGGDDVPFYWFAVVLRVAAELYLVGLVVRDVLQPGQFHRFTGETGTSCAMQPSRSGRTTG